MSPATLTLRRALRLPPAPCLALVGAGGKTRALFTLAREFDPPVLLTTTTHLAQDQADRAEVHWVLDNPSPEALARRLEAELPPARLLITGPLEDDRWTAPSPGQWAVLQRFAAARGLPLLVEADGAARKPLKAPAEHEPALPDRVTHVVTVVGIAALGEPLTEERVHRAARFAALVEAAPGATLIPTMVGRALAHPQGGRKGVPKSAAWAALLVGETATQLAASQRVAEAMWQAGTRAAVLVARDREATLELVSVHLPVAGVVLAAGPSHRMEGKNKLLLPVEGEPMVRRTAKAALAAGLDPVVVVVGYDGEQVAAAVADLPVRIVSNPHWEQGQSTSVRAGLQALPEGTGAAVFLLGDMPFVPPTLIRALVAAHAQTLAPIVAPLVDHRRGNPVLFDVSTFPELMALQGDVGGRALFERYRYHPVPWFDETTQIDLDTWEDYRRRA